VYGLALLSRSQEVLFSRIDPRLFEFNGPLKWEKLFTLRANFNQKRATNLTN